MAFAVFKILVLSLALACLGTTNGWGFNGNKFASTIKGKAAIAVGVIGTVGLVNYLSPIDLQRVIVPSVQAAEKTSVFIGNYNDPNHVGCMRKIEVKGKEVTLIGSDNLDGTKQWVLKAKEDFPGTIFVDFSPKGGPSNLLGVFNEEKNGISWPDGNLWGKIDVKK